MKEVVVTIFRKDLDNFEGQYKRSSYWFNLDHEFLKRKFSTLEPDFYNLYEKDTEGQDTEPYKTFLVTFDSTSLKPFMRNNPVKNRGKNVSGDDEEVPNTSESSSDKKK